MRVVEIDARVVVLLVDGQLLRQAERHAARNDRDLVNRIRVRQQHREQRVAGLVHGRHPLLFFGDDHGLALDAHQDLVLGVLEVRHPHDLLVEARGVERRLVDQIGEIRAGEPGRAPRQHADIHVVGQRNLARVDREDAFAALDVGTIDDDAAIEAARTQQRRIEHVGTVGRGHQDDAFVRLEAVHLDEQLVERLLALVVTAAETRRRDGGRRRRFRR